jgi:rhodanese-related sulfurtransferase
VFLFLAPCASAQHGARDLAPAAFQQAMAEPGVQLVDVRMPAEFASGHLHGAVNIDWTAKDYEAAFAKLDPKRPVLLYCHGGGRSEQALEHLAAVGYDARHLEGGITAWKKAGLPVER